MQPNMITYNAVISACEKAREIYGRTDPKVQLRLALRQLAQLNSDIEVWTAEAAEEAVPEEAVDGGGGGAAA